MSVQPTLPGGTIDGARHLFAVRAYYEDTDLSGIVYHANYLRWFERARSDLVRMLGIDQRAAIESGEGAYAVADLHIRYARPAKLDDTIVIESTCTEMGAASVRIRQRAVRTAEAGDGELIAEQVVRVGFVDPAGRPRRQPAEWRAAFAKFSEGHK
ncbi:YbgC/FadM family acyl-CoA thioesterase [Tsuneonella amylolytica]|uniref:YbgC/FadM family acyl-CoA thioesterase n=1 Tax=Tsuneonella amylolytica TaxID=2338327 RepID=UPI000EAA6815|nr:YbgC/FadM family acyl-CoA thioesterase [Tsuneonella amylolytica]